MSFYEENKNFIKQKFYFEMKGLDVFAKTENYNCKLKTDTRKRLINSYNNCNNSKAFFIECIDILQQYEFSFLFINLFFEENFEDIVVLLGKIKFNEIAENSNDILIKRFSVYFNGLKDFREFKAEDFLKSEFLDIIGIDDTIWKNKSKWPHTDFLKTYSKWIICNLSKNDSNTNNIIIYTAILFNKIWIEDIGFTSNHKNSKAIIFLQSLIQYFDNEIQKNNFINISSFYEELKNILDQIFVSGYFSTPLTDNIGDGFYSSEYYEKLKILKEKILMSRSFHESHIDYNYYELFLKLKVSKIDSISKQNIISQIYLKLDRTILPTEDELNSIKNIMGDDLFEKKKLEFFCKLYRFELL